MRHARLILGLLAVGLTIAPANIARAATPAAAPGEEDGYIVTADGLRLHYRVTGQGPEVVVIPLAAWLAPELEPLASGRRLVLYDPRGRGRSDRVSEGTELGIERDLEDLEAIRSGLGLPRISLIGWSYLGAAVALYASRHPHHVDRVVQMGPLQPRKAAPYSYELLPSQRPDPARQAELARRRADGMDLVQPAEFCRLGLGVEVLPSLVGTPEALSHMRADPCRFENEWGWNVRPTLGRVLGGIGEWDWSEAAMKVRAPTLVIHGDRDRVPLEGGKEWARLIPDARILVLPGAGHAAWLDAPGPVLSAIDAFLSGTWPSEARRLEATAPPE